MGVKDSHLKVKMSLRDARIGIGLKGGVGKRIELLSDHKHLVLADLVVGA